VITSLSRFGSITSSAAFAAFAMGIPFPFLVADILLVATAHRSSLVALV